MAGSVRMGLQTTFNGTPVRLAPVAKGVVTVEIGGAERGRVSNIAAAIDMAVDTALADGLIGESEAGVLREPPAWQHFTFQSDEGE